MPLTGMKNVYDNNRKMIFSDDDLRIWSVPSAKPGTAIIEVERLKPRTKSVWVPVWRGSIYQEINVMHVKNLPLPKP